MTTMTLDQAKDHLDDLLARAASGEKVVIVRDDGSTFSVIPDPVFDEVSANLDSDSATVLQGTGRVPQDFFTMPESFDAFREPGAPPIQRRPRREMRGILKGKIWMAPDFDDIPEGFEPYLGDSDDEDR